MSYSHTQKGQLDILLFVLMFIVLGIALLLHAQPLPFYLLALLATFLFTLGLSFGSLTVRDDDPHLVLSYGPLPWLSKRFLFADITSACPSRSRLIDGWGIHYLPWRGWTYNLWGFDCVEMQINGRRIRVGTDDAENLAEMIREKMNGDKSQC